MLNKQDTPEKTGLNPTVAIFLAIAISLIMVATTTATFLRSSAYTTVKQIQIGISATESIDSADGIDITSPINAVDIDEYVQDVKQRLSLLNDSADFGPEDVSDSALGL